VSPLLLSVTDRAEYSTTTRIVTGALQSVLAVVTSVDAVVMVYQASDIHGTSSVATSTPTSGARPGLARADTLLWIPFVATVASMVAGMALLFGL
jgi:hypothetical protein